MKRSPARMSTMVLGCAALALSAALGATTASSAAGAVAVSAPRSSAPHGAASGDNSALARQIMDEINRARTDPAEFAQRLEALEKARVDAGHVRLANGDTIQAGASYLQNAISAARSQRPLPALTWSDGMAKVTQAFADTNPPDHFAMASRFDAAGDWNDLKEAIGWENTALAFTYAFYISDGETTPGHRGIVDAPAFTQISVGCRASSRFSGVNTVCVLNTAMNWTDKGSPPSPANFAAPGLRGLSAPIGGSVGATVPGNRVPVRVDLANPVRVSTTPITPTRLPPLVSAPASNSASVGDSTPGGCAAADAADITDAKAATALRCAIDEARKAAGLATLVSNGPLDRLTATYASDGDIGSADAQDSLCPAGRNVSGYKGTANTVTAREAFGQITLQNLRTNSATAYLGVDARTITGYSGKQFAVILVICQ